MAEMPDDINGGLSDDPISQEALDALLSAASNAGDAEDSDAFPVFDPQNPTSTDYDMAGDADAAAGYGITDQGVVGDTPAYGDDGIISQDEINAIAGGMYTGEPMDSSQSAVDQSSSYGSFTGSTGNMLDLPSFDTPVNHVAVGDDGSYERVRDIPLDVNVELGRTRLLIKDILELSIGSIVELDKIAGEPVDLYANGILMARGEVIVIDDNFGVRITEIITAEERESGTEAHAIAA